MVAPSLAALSAEAVMQGSLLLSLSGRLALRFSCTSLVLEDFPKVCKLHSVNDICRAQAADDGRQSLGRLGETLAGVSQCRAGTWEW